MVINITDKHTKSHKSACSSWLFSIYLVPRREDKSVHTHSTHFSLWNFQFWLQGVKVLVTQSCPTLTPWTVARHAPLCMEFSRQECWSELPFPSLGDLHDPGIEPRSPALQAGFLQSEPPGNLLRISDWF